MHSLSGVNLISQNVWKYSVTQRSTYVNFYVNFSKERLSILRRDEIKLYFHVGYYLTYYILTVCK